MNETIFKRELNQQTTNISIVSNELQQSSNFKDQYENLIIQSNRMYFMIQDDLDYNIYFTECTLRLSSYQLNIKHYH